MKAVCLECKQETVLRRVAPLRYQCTSCGTRYRVACGDPDMKLKKENDEKSAHNMGHTAQ